MNSFDQTIERLAIYLDQVEGTLILFGVTDDIEVRDRAVRALKERMPDGIELCHFSYDARHLSLLEGVLAIASQAGGRVAVSVTGLEKLPRDKQTEGIKLLNFQRNRFGTTRLAVILWVTQALLSEIALRAADFYSWRSGTLFIEPPPEMNTLESARRSYLHPLISQNEYVNLQGLAPMRGGQIVQMRMDEIFIPLQVEQQANPVPVVVHGREEFAQHAELENYQRHLKREYISRKVKIAELLREHRAVVLGDPGAGKTTLLRYVAYQVARAQISDEKTPEFIEQDPRLREYLPVYMRIGLYAQRLGQNSDISIDEFAPDQNPQVPLSSELLQSAIRQSKALFLLDGLDEIVDATRRREVARKVEEFAGKHMQCPLIVTSRIVGYREAPLGGGFAQFTISEFGDDDIRSFAENWYRALSQPERAVELTDAILGGDTTRNDSIRKLASNPLLLTVIALIHSRQAKLPHQRVELYRMAAETLVNQWMSERRVIPEGWDVHETLNVLLPQIAWHLHQTSSGGLIDERKLHELLVGALLAYDDQLSESEAHTRAAQFRRNVSEFSGIFLERGADQDGRGLYGFLHLTFQEYFAAVRLTDRSSSLTLRLLCALQQRKRWENLRVLLPQKNVLRP